uniref:Uncharacterized protein n=1 Tax=Sus scrofa TaxID=9823 RepID=A0A8D0PSU9_PIG
MFFPEMMLALRAIRRLVKWVLMSFFSSGLMEPLLFNRFQNLLWSRKTFVDNMKIYNHSYIYMPAFSMKTGTEPSLRVYYTLSDVGANQTVLFANPNFLRSIGKFWKSRGIHAKRLSTGLFLWQKIGCFRGIKEEAKRLKMNAQCEF